jgi:LAO/AO transport system kinase
MWAMLEGRVFARLKADSGIKARLPRIETAVAEGRMSPAVAVDEIAAALGL